MLRDGCFAGEARHLKSLEEKNARLQRLLADAMFGYVALRDLLRKKCGRPPPSRKLSFTPGQRHVVSHKKLFRLYREDKLAVRRRSGRNRAIGMQAPLTKPLVPTERGRSTSCRTN